VLIFADQLVRSWKQITKFKPEGVGAPELSTPPRPAVEVGGEFAARPGDGAAASFSLEGLIRDERGVRVAPEAED